MFISVLDLFKIGIGPSSSHTMGPMAAALDFLRRTRGLADAGKLPGDARVRCRLKGSLAYTGKGHGTDRALVLGLHGYTPEDLGTIDVDELVGELWVLSWLELGEGQRVRFEPSADIDFDRGEPLPEHPNGMIFELLRGEAEVLSCETYFSIGGGFISTLAQITELVAPLKMEDDALHPYPFDSAAAMIAMAEKSGLSIAQMKRRNECGHCLDEELDAGLDTIWEAMSGCVQRGLAAEGLLPGGLKLPRRAKGLYLQLQDKPADATLNDWLCAYAMAVNEENAAGHRVVTAPTNGAAGVIPAVLYYFMAHQGGRPEQAREFLLTAAAIGGLIKYRSSISGAEVGCQGEVGSAASMAAAGLCAVRGGTVRQVENAAEIALEHHLGMTCDPVGGLVQVPCIERNA
ncbi:MAG: L-serine ammonia-lyase, partial [Chromatiales bacterium]|nr:L-serine ammonia-lyase [Chromatiales bacterium]